MAVIKKLIHDAGSRSTVTGVNGVCCRGCIKHICGRYDAQGFALGAFEVLA